MMTQWCEGHQTYHTDPWPGGTLDPDMSVVDAWFIEDIKPGTRRAGLDMIVACGHCGLPYPIGDKREGAKRSLPCKCPHCRVHNVYPSGASW